MNNLKNIENSAQKRKLLSSGQLLSDVCILEHLISIAS